MTSINITVEIDDILDGLDVADYKRLCERLDAGTDCKDTIREVLSLLRRNAIDDAVLLLERAFLPKWGSVGACQASAGMNGEQMGGHSDVSAKALDIQVGAA